jgi:transcriptional regulator with XRE-family HTH domain
MGIEERVGQNIKKYRLAHKLTLEELAAEIHKSKSTVSKYEKGMIAVDVVTLEEIAKVLKVSPSQLLSSTDEKNVNEYQKGEFLDRQYMYAYDGRSNKVLKSVIERYKLPDTEEHGIQMFYDVKDLQNPGECKALYAGINKKYQFVENYILQNQHNPIEHTSICCINSLHRTTRKMGMITGLSYKTMLPTAMKIMISSTVVKENEELVESLKLTKEDIRISKKYNLYTIDQFME